MHKRVKTMDITWSFLRKNHKNIGIFRNSNEL